MGSFGSGRKAAADFTPAEGVDPWGRQPGETDKAFAAFAAYRNLGAQRTVTRTVEALGKRPTYRRTCEEWSVRWGWRTRASAWDAHVDGREREAVLDVAEKKAREKLSVADGMWKTAAKALVMWNEYLDHRIKADALAGTPSVPPMSPGDVQRLADAGLKLSQLLEGKPTDIQEQRKQLAIDERRRNIQRLIGNPRLRAAMRQVAAAMEEERGFDGATGPAH